MRELIAIYESTAASGQSGPIAQPTTFLTPFLNGYVFDIFMLTVMNVFYYPLLYPHM